MEREPFTDSSSDEFTGPDVETKAREVGWIPEDEFRGDKSKWRSAEEFLQHADNVMPVLKKNNQKLFADLQKRDDAIRALQETVNEQSKVLKVLNEAANENSATNLENKLTSMKEALVEANRMGDAEQAADIQEQMLDLKLELREAKKNPVADVPNLDGKAPSMTAEDRQVWSDWIDNNSWFKDPALGAAANVIGAQIINEAVERGERPLKGRPLLDEITKRVDNKFKLSRSGKGDKTDGGSTGGGSTGGGGNSGRYSSLPASAKEACEAQAKKFVGPGKKYSDLGSWQKRFAELYYS